MLLNIVKDKFTYHSAPVEKPHGRLQCRTSRSQKKKSKSPERSKYCVNNKNYEQPTISSKSHSPSPYTKRRMCELSEDTRRRLAHLNLGPYEFKKETDKPPFVIRHVCAHKHFHLKLVKSIQLLKLYAETHFNKQLM
ncbi:spermatogenesis associated 6 [Cricetulus griseus]